MNVRYFLLLLLFPLTATSQDFGFSIQTKEGCGTLTTRLNNQSANQTDYTFEWLWRDQASILTTNVYADFPVGMHEVIMHAKDLNGNIVETIRDTVVVHRNPVVQIAADVNRACVNDRIQFQIDNVDADADIVLYQWLFGDGTVSTVEAPSHIYSFGGNYRISVIVEDANGCSSGQSEIFELPVSGEAPIANFEPSESYSCVDELLVNFENTTRAYLGHTISNYAWSFGDGAVSSEENVSHTFTGYGTNNVELTVVQDNGCINKVVKQITLSEFQVSFEANDYIKPDVDLTHEGSLEGCAGFVRLASTGSTASYFRWDIGNNDTIDYDGVGMFYASLNHEFTEPGVYPIRLEAGDNVGCSAEVIDTIVIQAPLQITYLTDTLFSCDTSDIHTLSVELSAPVDNISWLLNGSVLLGENETSIQTRLPEGVHDLDITITSQNMCSEALHIDDFAEVLLPIARFFDVSKTSGCIPLDVNFIGEYIYNPTLGNDRVSSSTWDLNGDNTIDDFNTTSTSFTFNTTGVFNARYTIFTEKGCESSASFNIFTGDSTIVDYSFTQEMCTWETAEFNQLTDLDARSFADTIWFSVYSMDDTTRTANEMKPIAPPGDVQTVHFDDTTGYFKLALMASDHGCRTNWRIDDSVIFVKGAIALKNKSFNCDSPYDYSFFTDKLIDADSISWNIYKYDSLYPYSDPVKEIPSYSLLVSNSSQNNPFNHVFDITGDYRLELIANNYLYPECADTSTFEWFPVRDLHVDFALTDYEVCLGDIILFDNATQTEAKDMIATELFWKLDTIEAQRTYITSAENKKNIIYESLLLSYSHKGVVDVWMKGEDLNGCEDSASKPVSVYRPDAFFKIENASNCLPFIASFIDSSSSPIGIAEREWYTHGDTNAFRSGNKLMVADRYRNAESKSPTLTVVDSFGCVNEYTIPDGIKPIVPDSRFMIEETRICVGGAVSIVLPADTIATRTRRVDSILWYFDDTLLQVTAGDVAPDLHYYSSAGDKKILAKAYLQSPTDSTCINADSKEIHVTDIALNLPQDSTNICKGSGDAIFWIENDVYSGLENVNNIKWYIDDVYYPTQDMFASNLRLSKSGEQEVKMVVTSDFSGCETIVDSIKVFVYGRIANLSLDKDEICVGEEVQLMLENQQFLETVPHYWLLGNGDRVEGIGENITYVYSSLPDIQNLTVKFKVDATSEKNTADCRYIEATAPLKIFPFDADFTRGLNDTDIEGCVPYTVELFNTSIGENSNYVWTIDGETTTELDSSYTFTEPGKTYDITLELSSSSCTQSKTKTITTYPNPSVNIEVASNTVCDFDAVELTANGNFATVENWRWNNQNRTITTPAITQVFDTTTFVGVFVESENGCKGNDSIKIYAQFEPYFTGAPEGGLKYYFANDSIVILAPEKSNRIISNEVFNFNNDSLPGVLYAWSGSEFLSCLNCYSPDIDLSCGNNADISCLDIPDVLTFSVIMTDSLGCYPSVVKDFSFDVIKEARIGMSTAFSPNGDGLNDFALPRAWAITGFIEMQVFNRWGQLIFQTDDMNVGWDGTFQGKPQKSGMYAYIIRGLDESNKEIITKGYITLLR